MLNFFAWYLLITLIGWLTFPLVYRLFPALKDRGYSLARVAGLLIWGYVFWLLASLGAIQNDGAGLAFALVILAVFPAIGLWKAEQRQGVWSWVRTNGRLIVTVEVLFFLSFALWAFVRASNPNIETAGGEKTMELAFINAIMRSPTFPPHDPWLSDYAISYYYFGYVMAAMLAKATSTLGSVAHNLMTSLIFALSMVGSYGVLYNLLAAWRGKKEVNQAKASPGFSVYSAPLLGPLFLLFVSNWEAFLYYLHKRGVFWSTGAGGEKTSAFWSWLGIQQLSEPSSFFNWWWRASRIIQDLDLLGNGDERIGEFPAFSFLLGDLHPHVLAIPFSLLVVAAALNLFRGGWKGDSNLYFYRLPIRPAGIFFGALMLGCLVFLNTWDILTGFALMAGTFVLTRIMEDGWSWNRLEDLFAFGLPVGVLAIILYLPFYLGSSSQAGGILPNLISPTRGAHLWVFFGTFFIALFPLLIYMWRSEKIRASWKAGFGVAAGLALLLWLLSWGLAFMAYKIEPAFVQGLINSQCGGDIGLCIKLASTRRLVYIGGLLTLLGLLGPALAFIIGAGKRQPAEPQEVPAKPSPFIFVMLLLAIGTVLVLTPDFIFLRDLFSSRSNTIFKFYYQAWMLWSLAAAFGAAILLQLESKNVWGWIYRPVLVIAIIVSLAFPVMGLPEKTNNFQITNFTSRLKMGQASADPQAFAHALDVWTLDGARLFHNQYPDDAAAADWLLHAPAGVIAEVVGRDAYSDYGRISVYSGQPTVLGWWFHEQQWRGGLAEQQSRLQNLTCRRNDPNITTFTRSDDIACLYQTSNWDEAAQVINEYHIRYVVVGTLERRNYRVNEIKFQNYMTQVFESGGVVIYEVSGASASSGTDIGDQPAE